MLVTLKISRRDYFPGNREITQMKVWKNWNFHVLDPYFVLPLPLPSTEGTLKRLFFDVFRDRRASRVEKRQRFYFFNPRRTFNVQKTQNVLFFTAHPVLLGSKKRFFELFFQSFRTFNVKKTQHFQLFHLSVLFGSWKAIFSGFTAPCTFRVRSKS